MTKRDLIRRSKALGLKEVQLLAQLYDVRAEVTKLIEEVKVDQIRKAKKRGKEQG